MSLSRIIYRLNSVKQEFEFFIILSWILFFPKKESLFYFLVFAVLIIIVSIRNIYSIKNIVESLFLYLLIFFNLLFIISVFFSLYKFKSILLLLDIFLICIYFVLFFYDKNDEQKYFLLLSYLISLFSIINIVNYSFSIFEKKNLFFSNPIMQGIISGIGLIILFYYILKRFNWVFFVLMILNLAGVFISASKAAFIGVVAFSFVLIILKRKRLIPFLIILIILTFIIPNPIKNMFEFSLTKDPYAFNRIDIWKMSVNIFKDNFLYGVGPGNFPEVSKKYNFKQTKGPANYFKVPRIPHNDYLKLLCETGLFGLIILIVFFFFMFKKIFSSPLFNISKVIILYLLFNAFLFNIMFHPFFLFIFIFFLKNLFEENIRFKSINKYFKLIFSFLLIFIFLVGYLVPYISNNLIESSKKSKNIVKASNLLKKSEYLNPLDYRVYYHKSLMHYNYFKKRLDLDSFSYALRNIKKTQMLNKYFIESYLLESDLFLEVLKEQLKYVSMEKEIIAPLIRAEFYAPFDPFIKLKKAKIYFEFNKKALAKSEAIKALELEPEFIATLYFLHNRFDYFSDEEKFKNRIDKISKKAKNLDYQPGTYLDNLFKLPQK